ncbi:hypothetical protein L2E82_08345 [Cichorium intybus]|uniref:Uncharacterized protein n=1 Tax=Cichorium intybus TaxID=13427 RepID=A0ACB9G7C2_CICIN|nr:hypothetical protein L2E82_08345 [Cichorium intybus]
MPFSKQLMTLPFGNEEEYESGKRFFRVLEFALTGFNENLTVGGTQSVNNYSKRRKSSALEAVWVSFNLCLFPSLSLPKWVLEFHTIFTTLLLFCKICKIFTTCRLLLIKNLGHRFLILYLTTRLGEKGFFIFIGF